MAAVVEVKYFNSFVLRDLLNLLLHIRVNMEVDRIAGMRRGLTKICN